MMDQDRLEELRKAIKTDEGKKIYRFIEETAKEMGQEKIDAKLDDRQIAVQYIANQKAKDKIQYILSILTPDEGD